MMQKTDFEAIKSFTINAGSSLESRAGIPEPRLNSSLDFGLTTPVTSK